MMCCLTGLLRSIVAQGRVNPRAPFLPPAKSSCMPTLNDRKNRLMDYNSMAKRSMELVLFTPDAQSPAGCPSSQILWVSLWWPS